MGFGGLDKIGFLRQERIILESFKAIIKNKEIKVPLLFGQIH